MPLNPKVLHIIYNPTFPSKRGRKLHEVLRWNDPDRNAQLFIDDVREASHDTVHFEIVERIGMDEFTTLTDGFRYTPDEFLTCWQKRSGFHKPEGADYHQILDRFDVVSKINRGEIDEVWVSGYPWAGLYESRMAGPGAFWCNAPPLGRTDHASRKFIVMGFSFERGVGEMLENLGHRAESHMMRVYEGMRGPVNMWERFTRYELSHPSRAEVGNVHFAPNSERDYDWGNRRMVLSRAHTWRNFPDLSGEPQRVNCREWGSGDIRLHHVWWFWHFPHVVGESNGISNNWWNYVIDPNKVGR